MTKIGALLTEKRPASRWPRLFVVRPSRQLIAVFSARFPASPFGLKKVTSAAFRSSRTSIGLTIRRNGDKDLRIRLRARHHCKRVMARCADAGRVPPASGVIVNAVELPAGLRTDSTELAAVVWTIAVAVISLVPVARPVTV
jgi:hypothetical protein